jgi:hypothetical protein
MLTARSLMLLGTDGVPRNQDLSFLVVAFPSCGVAINRPILEMIYPFKRWRNKLTRLFTLIRNTLASLSDLSVKLRYPMDPMVSVVVSPI